ncbi:MAG: tRNA lysidine(34) synthetase TilS [Bacteroidales bacterium]|nr:tRNA lysidine(34) synthetase TilS [Bacteroidales bacterium]
MLEKFESFVSDNNLFSKDDRILIALSGGVDSVVLSHLMCRANYKISLAHCNFHLRDEESNRDEAFVRSWAKENNIPLFVKEFDTYQYMKENKLSLEMAARDLRYNWFNSLLESEGFTCLCTAHHLDDSIETFFINLLRGTGIAGLHGIKVKNDKIVRPLLFATREEILSYANQNNISYVEDSTNSETKFTRNKIRHNLFPVLREINPNFEFALKKDIEYLRDTEFIFRREIEKTKKEIIETEQEVIKINISKLKQLNPMKIYLYEILSEYGFNETNINDILSCLDEISGKQFFSKTHRLVKDRHYIFIDVIKNNTTNDFFLIDNCQSSLIHPLKMQIELLRDLKFINISKDKNIAMLDADLLKFPLILRKWRQGDSFVPFGMKKEKKLSDYFTSNKYSLLDKENQWILCSEEKIVWLVAERIDDRFRISNKTKNILKIEVEK